MTREVASVFTGLKKDGDRLGKRRCRSLLPEAAFWISSSGNSILCPLGVRYCDLLTPASLRVAPVEPPHPLTQEPLPLRTEAGLASATFCGLG